MAFNDVTMIATTNAVIVNRKGWTHMSFKTASRSLGSPSSMTTKGFEIQMKIYWEQLSQPQQKIDTKPENIIGACSRLGGFPIKRFSFITSKNGEYTLANRTDFGYQKKIPKFPSEAHSNETGSSRDPSPQRHGTSWCSKGGQKGGGGKP